MECEDDRAAAVMVVVMVVGLRVTCRRALKCLISALALSAGARMEVISSPVPPGVGIWAGVLDRDLDADAGPDVALVRQCGQPQRRRPVQRRQGMGAGGGDENGSSRAPRARSAPGSQCDRSGPACCRRRPCAYRSTAGGCRPGCGLRPGRCAPGWRPGAQKAHLCAGACPGRQWYRGIVGR